MGLAQCQAAVCVVLVAAEKVAPVKEIGKGAGNDPRLIFITESGKKVIGVGKLVVDSDVEIVASCPPDRVSYVIKALSNVGIRLGIKSRQLRRQSVDRSAGENIGRIAVDVVSADRNSA
jgi:hypothetical protein